MKVCCKKCYSSDGFQNCFSCYNSENHQWYRMGYIVIFKHLAGIPNVALLVLPMVHTCYRHVAHHISMCYTLLHCNRRQKAVVYIYVNTPCNQAIPTPTTHTQNVEYFCRVYTEKTHYMTCSDTLKYNTLYTAITTCNMQFTAYGCINPDCIIKLYYIE